MASGNDMKAHLGTYEGFISKIKWLVPATALIALLVVVLIAD